ncbi:MAG TPA: hypothetical protein VFW96_05015 [Thermomicrobiales bacterium]|nr:hypothetical protein [Thermomicrobiales bacterium]
MKRRLLWAIPILLVVAIAGALAWWGLAGGRPGFTRAAAVASARRDAAHSEPEVFILDARIDTVTAERTTLGAATRRHGVILGPGQDTGAAVWEVTVRGYFRYESMPAPGVPPPVYEADERYFLYDARTGQQLGGGVSGPPRPASLPAPPGATPTP